MKKGIRLSTVAVLLVLFLIVTGTTVMAASTANTSFLPTQITDIFNLLGPSGICASQYVTTRVRWAFFLVLGGLVLVAVVYSILAAYKYVTSQGETGKIEEANKSIKAIFMGIAAMAVGIVGIVIVFTIIGAKKTDPSLTQVCINASASEGCKACVEDVNGETCTTCENAYEQACNELSANASKEDVYNEIKSNSKSTKCLWK